MSCVSSYMYQGRPLPPVLWLPQVLRDHLRGYERDLKEELYTVINRDLADYLSLSSKVRVHSSIRG